MQLLLQSEKIASEMPVPHSPVKVSTQELFVQPAIFTFIQVSVQESDKKSFDYEH